MKLKFAHSHSEYSVLYSELLLRFLFIIIAECLKIKFWISANDMRIW